MFVTQGSYIASSANISTYNLDVSTEVAGIPQLAALGATWTAIGSTESVSAATNIGFSASTVGIYRLDGTLIANGTGTTATALFSGSILNPIDINDTGGGAGAVLVWTGTSTDGSSALFGLALGASPYILTGVTVATDVEWIDSQTDGSVLPHRLYGISSTLTVPGAPEPEPGTTILVALGSGLLLLVQRARKMRPSHYSQTDR